MLKRSAVLLGASAVAWLAILECNRIYDTDVFWQVELGRETLRAGRWISTDTLTYTHDGERVPEVGWLAQAGFALVYELGGWRGVRLAHHGVWILALVVMGCVALRRGAGALGACLGCWMAFPVLLHAMHVRPQGISALGLAVVLWLADRSLVGWRELLAGFVVGVIWQNAHPSVLVGALAVGALAAGRAVEHWRGDQARWPWGLWLFAGLLAIAKGATPIGWGIFAVSEVNLRIARDVLRVGEWLPPWDFAVVSVMLPFWVAFGLSLAGICRWWREVRLDWLCVLLVMTGLVFVANRFTMYWALGMIPIWGLAASRMAAGWLPGMNGIEGETRWRRGWVTLGMAVGVAVIWWCHPAGSVGLMDGDLPLRGVAVLRTWLPGPARIYTAYEWSGPVLLERPAGWRVSVDGRLYCQGDEWDWRRRRAEGRGEVGLAELAAREGVDAWVLGHEQEGLIDQLASAAEWRLLWRGATCVIYVRAESMTVPGGFGHGGTAGVCEETASGAMSTQPVAHLMAESMESAK